MSGVSLAQLNRIVGSIYDGVAEYPRWQGFLRQLREVTHSDYVVVSLGDRDDWSRRVTFFEGLDAIRTMRSSGSYNQSGMLKLSPFTDIPENQVASLEELVDFRSLRQSEFFERYLAPLNTRHMMGGNFVNNKGQLAYVRLARGGRKSHFSGQDRELCTLLLPHLARSLKLMQVEDECNAFRQSLFKAMDNFGVGVFLLDTNRRILGQNQIAESHVAVSGDWAVLNGKLCLRHSASQILLSKAVGSASLSDEATPEAFSFAGTQSGIVHQLVVRALPSTPLSLGDGARALVFTTSGSNPVSIPIPTLQKLFGFSRAEAAVALGLTAGLSIADMAEKERLSTNTLYSQLKSVFGKLGVNQQSMVVGRILSSVAPLGND
ncbi:MAG: hypothetical protein JSR19_08160 [Proteobacteria bacterium]|nr:hypothetical protein [Pseudomonadota bacterium]HQR04412.1 hypothetical protein [Rhodocyclaceae bacterium]